MATSDDSVNLVLISGSTRSGSTNTAALRTLAELEIPGVAATLWDRLVDVPAFVPDDDAEPPALGERAAVPPGIGRRRGVLHARVRRDAARKLQEYDRLARGSGELYRTPAAWINVGNPGRGAGAEAALATVLGYVDADVVQQACVRIPVGRDAVGLDGTVDDADVRARLASVLGAVAEHVRSLTDRPSTSLPLRFGGNGRGR